MDSKEYFDKYKDKIYETAEFLCSKDATKNVEAQFEELKSQYLNCDGPNITKQLMLGTDHILFHKSYGYRNFKDIRTVVEYVKLIV